MTEKKLTPASVASEDLRAAAEDMEQAALREGIAPDGPLGVWVSTMRRGLIAFANVIEHQSERVEGTIGGARKLVEAEIVRLRLSNEGAIQAMNEATVTFNRSKIDAEKMSLKTIDDLTPKLLQEIREGVVIRERRHNRGVEWRRAIMAITAGLSLVIGGYPDQFGGGVCRRCVDRKVTKALFGDLLDQADREVSHSRISIGTRSPWRRVWGCAGCSWEPARGHIKTIVLIVHSASCQVAIFNTECRYC